MSVWYTFGFIIVVCCCCLVCQGSHFAGGLITWGPTGNGSEIDISYRMTYTTSHLNCASPESTPMDNMMCFRHCSGIDLGTMNVQCTESNSSQNWASGTGHLTYTPTAPVVLFGYKGSAWIDSISNRGSGSWELVTMADVRPRADTGRINSSPSVDMAPITIKPGCVNTIVIPVFDADGDTVQCRMAQQNSSQGLDECGGVCGFVPSRYLDEVTCILRYIPAVNLSTTVAAIQIEDFANSTRLSSVPLQLLIFIDPNVKECGTIPEFVGSTPEDGEVILARLDGTFSFRTWAVTSTRSRSVRHILLYSNLKHMRVLLQSPSYRIVDGDLTMEPTRDNYTVCFYAQDNYNLYSRRRCVYIKDPPGTVDVPLGGDCSSSNQRCQQLNSVCVKVHTNGTKNCLCSNGFHDDNGPSVLGGECRSSSTGVPLGADCSGLYHLCMDTNSSCVLDGSRKACLCMDGFYDDNGPLTAGGVCQPKLAYDEPCAETGQCSTWLATCVISGTGQDKRCLCAGDSKYDEVSDSCLDIPYCEEETDQINNLTWSRTMIGHTAIVACPDGHDGTVTRVCSKGGLFLPPFYNCTKQSLNNLNDQITNGDISSNEALENLAGIVSITSEGSTSTIYAGDLDTIETSLNLIVDNVERGTHVGTNETKNFINVVNFILDSNTTGDLWSEKHQQDDRGAGGVLDTVDRFLQTAHRSLPVNGSINVEQSNMVLKVATIHESTAEIQFPGRTLDQGWSKYPSSLKLSTSSFKGLNVTSFSSVIYKNISGMTTSRLNGVNSPAIEISSQVISLQLYPQTPKVLDPALEMTFTLFQAKTGIETHCAFWNGSMADGRGGWSTDGCVQALSSNTSHVTCLCSHLTNFAILISPVKSSARDKEVLSIISIVGCSISMVFLLITILANLMYWRHIRGTKTTLSVTLCTCLLVAYALFIGGVTQTKYKSLCRAIAVLLHFTYLTVFFLMLAEGIHMIIQVAFLFHKKQHLRELLVMAFLTPAVIVAISMGINLEGYGNDEYCWFQAGSWQFWTFAGPVLLVICINAVFIVIIMVKLHSTAIMKLKDTQQKAKTTAWTLGVLLPVMGVTWVLGVFSVSEETSWLQYVFVVTNSLQGFGIFFFHCFLNKQLRNAIKTSRRRKETLSNFTSKGTRSNPSRSDTRSTDSTLVTDTTDSVPQTERKGRIKKFLIDVKNRSTQVFTSRAKRVNITKVKFQQNTKVPVEFKEKHQHNVTFSDIYSDSAHSDNESLTRPPVEVGGREEITVDLTVEHRRPDSDLKDGSDISDGTSSDKGLLEKIGHSELKFIDAEVEMDSTDAPEVRL